MRICFIAHQASKEGAGRFLLDQIDYLKNKNIVVFVIVPAFGPLCEALRQRGVEFQVVPTGWWVKGSFNNTDDERALILAAAHIIAKFILIWKIDVVYTQTIVTPAGALAAAITGKPHVWHIHEFSYNPECIELVIAQPDMSRLLDLTSNLIVFNSLAVAAEWRDFLPANRTKIIRNWVDPKNVAAASDALPELNLDVQGFRIVMVGSVLPWKRQMDAVQAVANLIGEDLDVSLLIVGPLLNEPYHQEISAFIENHKLQSRIRLIGYMENPGRVVKLAHAAVVCSRLEPFGRVTVEAMNWGIPVVGANSGGTVEIIEDEISGLLYPVGNVVALASQLKRLITDENLRQRLGKNAMQRAAQFGSAEKEMEPLLDRLSSILKTSNPSWPLGQILSPLRSNELAGADTLGICEHGRLLFYKIKRRAQNLFFGKSQAL